MRRTTFPILGLAVVALGFLAGCPQDQVNFHDDLDFVFDFKPFDPLHPPGDDLHIPYVVGAEMRMYALRDHDKMNLESAWAESLDTGVLDLWDRHSDATQTDFRCRATGPGTTEVVIWRNEAGTRAWGRAAIEVAQPKTAELTFAGPLFIDAGREEFRVNGPVNVLVGGTATFLVEYADATGRRLYGNGVLEVSQAGEGMDAYADQTWLFEDREWLVVTPLTPGDHVVDLKVGGRSLGAVTIHAVQDADVAIIDLRRESESGHDNGDFLAVLALGYTDTGDPIYGIEYSWEVDGFPKAGEGDLYKYEYDRRDTSSLQADFNGHTQKTTIHSAYNDGWVSSTNNIGCTAAATPGRWTSLVLMLVPLGLLALRRRRVPSPLRP